LPVAPLRFGRFRLPLAWCAFALAGLAPSRVSAECERGAPWNRLGDSAENLIEPVPLLLIAASPVPVLVFSPSGLDHDARLLAQRDLGGRYQLESVSLYAPYVLAGGVLVGFGLSAIGGACDVQKPQAAVLQAMLSGFVLTGALKWAVGREWPNAGQDPFAPNRLRHDQNARAFRPFEFRFGAWPSGHTLSMFAAASAFRASLPEAGLIRFVGYPLALGVGAGMWLGDRHWASDVLSGALLGEALGSSVGRSFADEKPSAGLANGSFLVLPMLPGGLVAGYAGVF
jgi:membrane-associated phospholipid phosphatase